MAATNNLSDYLTLVANTIRTKLNLAATVKINAQDFPSKIGDIYTKGVTDADARVNTSSASYAAAKTAYEPTQATLSNAGVMVAKNAAGTQVYTQTFTNSYNAGNTAGQATGKTNYEPKSYTLSNAGALVVKNAAGTSVYSATVTNSYDSGYSVAQEYYEPYNVFVAKDGSISVDNYDQETIFTSTTANSYNAGVSDTKVGTAAAAQVLTGYTFTNSSSVGANGSMTNNGAIDTTISTNGGSYTIPAGYHNGSGKVKTKTWSASDFASGNIELTAQTGTSVVGKSTASVKSGSATTPATTIKINPTLSATYTENKGYLLSVSKTQNVTPTVSAGWVASGTAGTITVQNEDTPAYVPQATMAVTTDTASAVVLNYGQKWKVAAGYYPTDRYFATPDKPTLSGDATEAYVYHDKTFYSNSYTKLTGSMPDATSAVQGSSNGATNFGTITPGVATQYLNITAGYTPKGYYKISAVPSVTLSGDHAWGTNDSNYVSLATSDGWFSADTVIKGITVGASQQLDISSEGTASLYVGGSGNGYITYEVDSDVSIYLDDLKIVAGGYIAHPDYNIISSVPSGKTPLSLSAGQVLEITPGVVYSEKYIQATGSSGLINYKTADTTYINTYLVPNIYSGSFYLLTLSSTIVVNDTTYYKINTLPRYVLRNGYTGDIIPDNSVIWIAQITWGGITSDTTLLQTAVPYYVITDANGIYLATTVSSINMSSTSTSATNIPIVPACPLILEYTSSTTYLNGTLNITQTTSTTQFSVRYLPAARSVNTAAAGYFPRVAQLPTASSGIVYHYINRICMGGRWYLSAMAAA